jgi:tetratricopeptide (TPR) repeat protein
MGQALRRKGDVQAAQFQLKCAIRLAQQHQNGQHVSEALTEIEMRAYSWLCSIALSPLQDFVAARDYSEQRIAICRRWNKRYGEAVALTDLVDIALAQDDLHGARSECQHVYQLAQEVGSRWLQGISARSLGEIHRLLGEYSIACALTSEALALFRAVGDIVNEISCLTALGRLYTLMGAYDLAHEWFGYFQQRIATVETPAGELLDGLLAQVLLAYYRRHDRQMSNLIDRSWELAQTIGDPIRQAQVQLYRGHGCAALEQWDAAAAAYRQALLLFLKAGKELMAAEPRAGLATVALMQGDLSLAQEQVVAILPMLAANQRVGSDEPFYTYRVCQRVLAASGDARAEMLLEQIHALQQHDAAYITDDALRYLFLQHLSAHDALMWR